MAKDDKAKKRDTVGGVPLGPGDKRIDPLKPVREAQKRKRSVTTITPERGEEIHVTVNHGAYDATRIVAAGESLTITIETRGKQ